MPAFRSPPEGGGEGSEDEDDPGGEDGGDERGDVSCIGVRKVCLQGVRCNQSLNDFRSYCHENKKSNECVAPDLSVLSVGNFVFKIWSQSLRYHKFKMCMLE